MSRYQWTYLEEGPHLTTEGGNKADKVNGEEPEGM